jgi:hypothetical protein
MEIKKPSRLVERQEIGNDYGRGRGAGRGNHSGDGDGDVPYDRKLWFTLLMIDYTGEIYPQIWGRGLDAQKEGVGHPDLRTCNAFGALGVYRRATKKIVHAVAELRRGGWRGGYTGGLWNGNGWVHTRCGEKIAVNVADPDNTAERITCIACLSAEGQ